MNIGFCIEERNRGIEGRQEGNEMVLRNFKRKRKSREKTKGCRDRKRRKGTYRM